MVSKRELRKRLDFSKVLAAKGWYHSFELPDGRCIDGYTSLPVLRERWARFPIPADLTGSRLLDIGAWDGWFSFEAERRGGRVTAVDCVEIPHFRWIHKLLASSVDYRILDVLDIEQLGVFDYTFFLGVLYHLRHPLLALETVCRATTEVALVDSFVTDVDGWRDSTGDVPTLEFYERDELGGQLDNWFGPSVAALMAMCRAAGFPRVELLHAEGFHAQVACFRRWEPVPPGALAPPELESVANSRGFGVNFTGRRDEYVSCWFRSSRSSIRLEELRFEAGGFGAPALYLAPQGDDLWLANVLLPPGLPLGWVETRIRFADSSFSDSCRIAVGIPARAERLTVLSVCDGLSFVQDRVQAADPRFLTFWIQGLPETCDRNNVRACLGDWRLAIDWIGPAASDGCRQINARVPADVPQGAHAFTVGFAGLQTKSQTVMLE